MMRCVVSVNICAVCASFRLRFVGLPWVRICLTCHALPVMRAWHHLQPGLQQYHMLILLCSTFTDDVTPRYALLVSPLLPACCIVGQVLSSDALWVRCSLQVHCGFSTLLLLALWVRCCLLLHYGSGVLFWCIVGWALLLLLHCGSGALFWCIACWALFFFCCIVGQVSFFYTKASAYLILVLFVAQCFVPPRMK